LRSKVGKKYRDKERKKGNSKMEGKRPPVGGRRAQKLLKQIFFFEKIVDRSGFTGTWTLDPLVKPFDTTMKKEERNEV